MKKTGKRRICFMLCALLLTAVLAAPCSAAEAGGTDPAAGQAGAVQDPGQQKDTVALKQTKKGYVCYVNGVQVKGRWMTIEGKGRYYFKKDGYAATLSTKIGGSYYVFNKKGQLQQPSATKIVTIGKNKYLVTNSGKAKGGWYTKNGKKYYFDKKTGVMYTGIHVIGMDRDFMAKFYAFKSNGKYDASRTKKIRKAAKYEKDITALKKLLGNPSKKKYTSGGCYQYKGQDGKDGVWTYKNFIVSTFRTNKGKEIYMGADPR